MRIVSKAAYKEHTNQIFVNLKALQFRDLVDLKTAQFIIVL